MNNEIIPILALQNIKGYGIKRISKILETIDVFLMKDYEQLYNALDSVPFNIKVPSKQEVELSWKNAIEIIKKSTDNNISIISIFDDNYPTLLKNIGDPPLLLHYKGNFDLLTEKSVAVVGTRKPCDYSKNATVDITKKLVDQDYCIVSGLAEGIDTIAHETTLKFYGNTIGVVGHGLHMIYPEKNTNLAKRIIENDGLLLSEYTFGTTYNRGYFIARDRIQSGLSSAVYVIETAIKGGTMKTADYCINQDRKLFVLKPPNQLESKNRYLGNIYLLSHKAIPIELDDKIEYKSSNEKKFPNKKIHEQKRLF